ETLGLRYWELPTTNLPIQREEGRSAYGKTLRVSMEGLPALPDEPYSFPAEDLSNRFMAYPNVLMAGGQRIPLAESWDEVAKAPAEGYAQVIDPSSRVEERARSLAGGGSKLEQAERLFRWVRDEIVLDPDLSSNLLAVDVDEVLAAGAGSQVEKQALLASLLEAADLDPRMVWLANRMDSRVDMNVKVPAAWFDATVVGLQIDGAWILLDPSDPGLAFGQLPPTFDGMPAVVVDRRRAEILELPFSTHEDNARRVTLDLEADADGRLRGSGRVELTGALAWAEIDTTPEDDVDGWRERLAGRFDGYDVAEVAFTPEADARRAIVTFALTQRDEDVLGDEIEVWPARPLTATQPFTLEPSKRLTPVQFLHARSDEVTVNLSWPDGFAVDLVPKPTDAQTPAGAYIGRCTIDETARTARCTRRMERHKAVYLGKQEYTLVRQLYAKAAERDQQALVLISDTGADR
ncbi:MAG: hypothetical protein AAGN46_18730, partial [Acidobacteriota bacterium]